MVFDHHLRTTVVCPPQIYFHLNNVFELMSKAVVESKQKVNIPKLSKEEPEEKEENEVRREGAKEEEEEKEENEVRRVGAKEEEEEEEEEDGGG